MADIDLIFSRSPLDASPIDLVFGGIEQDTETVQVLISATLPGMTFVGSMSAQIQAALSGMMPPMVFAGTTSYISNAQRPLVGTTLGAWQVAVPEEVGAQNVMQSADRVAQRHEGVWGLADRVGTRISVLMPKTFDKMRAQAQAAHRNAEHLTALALIGTWENLLRGNRPSVSSGFQDGVGRRADTVGMWANMLHYARPQLRANHQVAVPIEVGRFSNWQVADALSQGWLEKHREAIRPPAGTSVHVIVPPLDPDLCYYPPPGDAVHLIFRDGPGTSDLVFFCENHAVLPTATVVVPIRRVYMIVNNVTLRRVVGNVAIPAFAISMSIDAESWTWSFSTTIPGGMLSTVEPFSGEPVELEASINGVPYRFLVEQISRDRSFNSSAVRVSGRGKNAILDTPYSPSMNFTNVEQRTAQQLMNDALTFNGSPIGWDIDFGLDDWLVPAGVWAHQGSYISAINAIAQAAGGYVQPHPTADSLIILPRYPTGPWDWESATPDFELPAAVTVRESIEWRDKADYNRVFVSGTSQGVLGQITRAGSLGDLVAPMVTDALITEAIAARQRGLAVLSDTGRQAAVTLRLPVLAETGVIAPGKLVRYVDGSTVRLGLVRSTSVDVSQPEVFQTIGVETHA